MEINGHGGILPVFGGRQIYCDEIEINQEIKTISGALPLAFNSDGSALTNYKIHGYSSSQANIGSGVVITTNSKMYLNGNDTGINLGALALYANEYADFEEQKIYQIGNYLDSSVFENGYYPTGNHQWLPWQSTTNMACLRTPIFIPCSQYSDVGDFKIYTDLSGYKYQIAPFNSTTVSTASAYRDWWGSDISFGGLLYSMYSHPYILLLIHKSDWSDFNASALSGHIWIKYSNLDSSYVPYNTMVSTSATLPAIMPASGQNTLTYTANPCTMDITGKIDNV